MAPASSVSAWVTGFTVSSAPLLTAGGLTLLLTVTTTSSPSQGAVRPLNVAVAPPSL